MSGYSSGYEVRLLLCIVESVLAKAYVGSIPTPDVPIFMENHEDYSVILRQKYLKRYTLLPKVRNEFK